MVLKYHKKDEYCYIQKVNFNKPKKTSKKNNNENSYVGPVVVDEENGIISWEGLEDEEPVDENLSKGKYRFV